MRLPALAIACLAAWTAVPVRGAVDSAAPTASAGTGPAVAGADPAPDPAAAPPADPALAEDANAARQAARTRFVRLLSEGRNEEAVRAGEELLELTRAQFGAGSIRLAAPLTNLGTARLRAGQLPAAEASYKAAVELVEGREGILALRLVPPLVGLGETYTRAGQYADAAAAYERALRVNQVNEGIYNTDQIPIRDGLSESYLGLQDLDKANFHQEAQIPVTTRRVGSDSAALGPALLKLGRWYERSGQPERARFAYQKAARLVEAEQGEDSPALVDSLLAIGDTYRAQALLPADPNSGEAPMGLLPLSSAMYRRALEILERQDPPDAARQGRAYVALGDLYMLWGRRKTAELAYGRAWEALADPALGATRDDYFDAPVRLMGPEPPRLYPRSVATRPPQDQGTLLPGTVSVRYGVDALGKAVDVTLLESDPPGLVDDAVLAAVRGALFRPRYVDGAPVVAAGIVYQHAFRYREGALKPKPVETPEGGRIEPPGAAPLPPPPPADPAPLAPPAAGS
jgi:tetratricopeptide (TPR) repeat protein